MVNEPDRRAANRAAAEHVERMRRRLADGRAELDRMRASVADTNDHMASMADWIDETDRHLRDARRRLDE